MPEVTDLMRVAQWAKSSGSPSDVYNAACRLLDNRPGFTLIDQALDAQAAEVHVRLEDEDDDAPEKATQRHGGGRSPQTQGAVEGQEATEAQGSRDALA